MISMRENSRILSRRQAHEQFASSNAKSNPLKNPRINRFLLGAQSDMVEDSFHYGWEKRAELATEVVVEA